MPIRISIALEEFLVLQAVAFILSCDLEISWKMFIVVDGRASFLSVCSLIQIDFNALHMHVGRKEKSFLNATSEMLCENVVIPRLIIRLHNQRWLYVCYI